MEPVTLTNIPVLLLSSDGKVKTMLAAPLPVDLAKTLDGFGYWYSDIILMPKKKYECRMGTEKSKFADWKYSDVLKENDWPNPKYWNQVE